MKTKLIVRTIHGSYLYGLARPDSDKDYYEIYDFLNNRWRPKKQSKQRIIDELDELKISLDRFKSLCFKGVPQCIEVLFSPPEAWVEVDNSWYGISKSIKEQLPNHMPDILNTYRRTALNFYYSPKDSEKKKRHAFRLLLNARELKERGAMDVRLDAKKVALINELTTSFHCEEKFKDMIYEIF